MRKRADARASDLCVRAMEGWQVSILRLGSLRATAREAVAAGADDASVIAVVRAEIEALARVGDASPSLPRKGGAA
jgi:electron transfer flavoprotein alpha/beta subunit